jgi:preprotein translocase subunit SecB
MSDTSANETQVPVAPVRFVGQFIRDLSFEVPRAPEVFAELREAAPDIPVSFDIGARHVGGTTFEVTLAVNVQASVKQKPAFIMELVYGALLEVDPRAVPEDQLHPMLLIEIPRYLFPFVRQQIADLTVGGGFPPLFLQMVDFVDMYRRKFGEQQQRVERIEPQA